jgi:nuclear transport factor 2 (NTF2) superfamily protein
MRVRHACINDLAIDDSSRLFRWERARARPFEHPSLSDLGL